MRVNKSNSLKDIAQYVKNLRLREGLLLLGEVQQVAVPAVLHNQVEVVSIREVPVELHDVGVMKVRLNLYLLDECIRQVLLQDALLRDRF